MNQLILDSERVEELRLMGWDITRDHAAAPPEFDSPIHVVRVKKNDYELGAYADTRSRALDRLRTSIAQHEKRTA